MYFEEEGIWKGLMALLYLNETRKTESMLHIYIAYSMAIGNILKQLRDDELSPVLF